MTSPAKMRWLTADLERMRRPAIISLLDDMDDVSEAVRNQNVVAIIAWIKKRRSAYWDSHHSGNPMVSASGFTGMTATEINEDLCSRPPVPLWGE